MATTTTRLVLRKPDPTPGTGDLVSALLDLNQNWDKVDASIGAVACTSGARPASPFNGQLARETDTGNIILWTGSAWTYIFWNQSPTVHLDDPTNITAISSTTFEAGSPVCGVAFVAPPSGRAAVHWAARMESNTGNGVLVSVEVRTGSTIGSGTVLSDYDPQDSHSIEIGDLANGNLQAANFRLITGLTPGASYNARTMQRVTAGDADIFDRYIMVRPES
jgi:hypothetical protein